MNKGYSTIHRPYVAMCKQCMGSGFQATKHGLVPCSAPDCKDGNVERWLNEVVNDDEAPAPTLPVAR